MNNGISTIEVKSCLIFNWHKEMTPNKIEHRLPHSQQGIIAIIIMVFLCIWKKGLNKQQLHRPSEHYCFEYDNVLAH